MTTTMKIDDLIDYLKTVRDEKGNIPVLMARSDPEYSDWIDEMETEYYLKTTQLARYEYPHGRVNWSSKGFQIKPKSRRQYEPEAGSKETALLVGPAIDTGDVYIN